MTVGMTVMSLPSCAVSVIAPPAGADVPAIPITAAYQSGFSAMERMTVEMAQMSCLKTALSAQKRATSSAGTSAVWHSDGFVTLKMIVETTQMRMKPCARVDIVSVLNQNSGAPMTNVFQPDGSVTRMMIAVMAVMRRNALLMTVQLTSSSVAQATASRKSSSAMVTRTVLIFQMNWTAHHVTQAGASAQRAVLSVPTISVFV